MKKTVLRSFVISLILGFITSFMLIATLPIYSEWSADGGYTSLTGLQILVNTPNNEFAHDVVGYSIVYFVVFFVVIFFGCLWQGIWHNKDNKPLS